MTEEELVAAQAELAAQQAAAVQAPSVVAAPVAAPAVSSTSIGIGPSNKLSFHLSLGSEKYGPSQVADFELNGKRVVCNTWSTEVPANAIGVYVRGMEQSKPFTGRNGEQVIPPSDLMTARFVGWNYDFASKAELLKIAGESGFTNLGGI